MVETILLDTNVYLRLADSFRPLISTEFGSKPYRFRLVPEVIRELSRGTRLRGKFHWISSPEYVYDRKKRLLVPSEKVHRINETYKFMKYAESGLATGASPTDIKVLAYGLVLDMKVATDDKGMKILANEFDVSVVETVQLLKLMHDEKRVALDEVKNAVEMMEYRNDIPDPRNFWKKMKDFFPSAFKD